MNKIIEYSKAIIGLVGYRCCGKSTLRNILIELNIPVFDTNSVKTGDPDANQISFDEVLRRYGKNKSYFIFLEDALRKFVRSCSSNIVFIDSLKVRRDSIVIKEMFPNFLISSWYLHASFEVRQERYLRRDIETNVRSQKLEEHDDSLEKHGIWNLIKDSREVINMELPIQNIKKQVEETLSRIKNQLVDG